MARYVVTADEFDAMPEGTVVTYLGQTKRVHYKKIGGRWNCRTPGWKSFWKSSKELASDSLGSPVEIVDNSTGNW